MLSAQWFYPFGNLLEIFNSEVLWSSNSLGAGRKNLNQFVLAKFYFSSEFDRLSQYLEWESLQDPQKMWLFCLGIPHMI